MGALLKFGNRKAGDGKGMAGSDSVGTAGPDSVGTARPDSVKEESQTNSVVATLIATVTFTTAFTVPGGYQNQGVDEGLAVLSKRASFRAFLIANTFAFAFSITSILIHFIDSLRRETGIIVLECVARRSFYFTYYAIIALLVAFISGTYTVVPHSLGITAAVILYCCFLKIGRASCRERV